MNKPSLFGSNSKDEMIELYFSEEEIVALIEMLTLTKEICAKACEDKDNLDVDQRVAFQEKADCASMLLTKIISDASPGVPSGDLH